MDCNRPCTPVPTCHPYIAPLQPRALLIVSGTALSHHSNNASQSLYLYPTLSSPTAPPQPQDTMQGGGCQRCDAAQCHLQVVMCAEQLFVPPNGSWANPQLKRIIALGNDLPTSLRTGKRGQPCNPAWQKYGASPPPEIPASRHRNKTMMWRCRNHYNQRCRSWCNIACTQPAFFLPCKRNMACNIPRNQSTAARTIERLHGVRAST